MSIYIYPVGTGEISVLFWLACVSPPLHCCLHLNPAQVIIMLNITPIKTPIPIPFPRASLSSLLQSAAVAFVESGKNTTTTTTFTA